MYLLVFIALYIVSNATTVHIVYTSQLSLTELGLFQATVHPSMWWKHKLTVDHVYIPPPALLFFFLFEPHYKAWLSQFCQPIVESVDMDLQQFPLTWNHLIAPEALPAEGNPAELRWCTPNQLVAANSACTQVCSGVSVSMHLKLMRQEAAGRRPWSWGYIHFFQENDQLHSPS